MPFTVRVELSNALPGDYEALHAQMEARGFVRFVIASDGRRSRLPPGEYRFERISDLNTITNAAKAAASTTGRSYGVLVSEATQLMWFNLPPMP